MALDIKTFSEQIGVSTATVSRAFSGRGRISDETRARVLEEAKRYGFAPNVHASRLNMKRTGLIGLYYSFSDVPIFDYYNMELAQEVAKAAERRDYAVHLELSGSSSDRENERLRALTRGNGLDGVILVVDGRSSGLRQLKHVEGCPATVITSKPWPPHGDETIVELDLNKGITEAVSELVKLGHRKIAFLASNKNTLKLNNFCRALQDHGLEARSELIVNGAIDFAQAQEAFRQIAPRRPSAILCATDILALGVLAAASQLGLEVPRDLSVVGMDDLGFTAFTTPSLATIGIPRAQIASTAVDSILSRLESENSTVPRRSERRIIGSLFIPRCSISRFEGYPMGNN